MKRFAVIALLPALAFAQFDEQKVAEWGRLGNSSFAWNDIGAHYTMTNYGATFYRAGAYLFANQGTQHLRSGIVTLTNDWTISVWCRMTNHQQGQVDSVPFSIAGSATQRVYFTVVSYPIAMGTGVQIRANFNTNVQSGSLPAPGVASNGIVPALNSNFNMVAWKSGTVFRGYLNGSLYCTSSATIGSSAFAISGPSAIGGYASSATNATVGFGGYVLSVTIYDRALTTNDINAIQLQREDLP